MLLQVATAAVRSWAVLHLSATLNLQWLGNVFAHLMRLPMAWFEKRHTGDVWSRFAAVQQIQKTLTTHFIEAVLDGLLVVATLAMMLFYSVTLAAIVLGAVVVYALLRWAFFRPLREATEEALVHEARQSSHFLESLRGVQSIKLFNRQADRQARFMNRVVDTMNADIATRKLELLFSVLHRLLFGIERVRRGLGRRAAGDGPAALGRHAVRIRGLQGTVRAARQRVDRQVRRVAHAAAARRAPGRHRACRAGGLGVPRLGGERGDATAPPPRIEVRGLSFRYADGEPDVLHGVNFSIEPGESVAIVGPSGCGKTTLLKLMLGIHVPAAGELRVDGVPLAQLGLASWRDDGRYGDAGRCAARRLGG